jgi:sulfite reductase (NADPH) flavoprotein alpha-component
VSPETERCLTAGAVLLAYAAFCGFIVWRRRRRRAPGLSTLPSRQAPVLVAYASQTGFAEEIARRSAESLQEGGVPARLARLETLDADTLAVAGRAVFIVSTTGEGDAPDHAARFVRRVMGRKAALTGLDYGLLALGDSSYAHYCAFGRQLDAWLQTQGATPLFDRVEVDDADGGALRRWQHHLGKIAGASETPDWAPARFAEWRLIERRRLNPGSPGGPAFHLALEPMEGGPKGGPEGGIEWQAGDIAEIGPRNAREALDRFPPYFLEALRDRRLPDDPAELAGLSPEQARGRQKPLPHREYSIASLPSEGRLELLVRQARHPDGRLGIGSGWLTEYAPMGSPIALRVRSNRSFHPPEDDRPMILIGNGTGIAGLRVHLKARAAAGRHLNWLVFGERTRAQDFFYRAEVEGWLADGVLARLDLAFSRDQEERLYVQDRLREAADTLREWTAEGAAIYVCGSLKGMSTGVHAALVAALGHESLERLAEKGLYRRDVY